MYHAQPKTKAAGNRRSAGGLSELVLTGDEYVKMAQSVVVVGGVHIGFMGNSTLTLGAEVPLTLQSYDVEGIAQLNIRF